TSNSVTAPLSTYGNFRFNESLLQQAAATYNQNIPARPAIVVPQLHLVGPNSLGMDEDYDACDLENWFLAIQSADGQVTIPSFHRPGILTADDWTSSNVASRAKILRPRPVDHPSGSFVPLLPDPATGQITYDVDND